MISAKPRFYEKVGIIILAILLIILIPLMLSIGGGIQDPGISILSGVVVVLFLVALILMIKDVQYYFGTEIIIDETGVIFERTRIPWREIEEIRIGSGLSFYSIGKFEFASRTSNRRKIKITSLNGREYHGIVSSDAISYISNILKKHPILDERLLAFGDFVFVLQGMKDYSSKFYVINRVLMSAPGLTLFFGGIIAIVVILGISISGENLVFGNIPKTYIDCFNNKNCNPIDLIEGADSDAICKEVSLKRSIIPFILSVDAPTQEICLLIRNRIYKKPENCAKLSYWRNNLCYYELAINTKTRKYCEEIGKISLYEKEFVGGRFYDKNPFPWGELDKIASNCREFFDLLSNDISICEKYGQDMYGDPSEKRMECVANYAIAKEDPSLCNTLDINENATISDYDACESIVSCNAPDLNVVRPAYYTYGIPFPPNEFMCTGIILLKGHSLAKCFIEEIPSQCAIEKDDDLLSSGLCLNIFKADVLSPLKC